ncbi:MAG: ShlB/FhaC/HecB family hemolysin secretion/activation protein [Betaproteobacteria bacterium]
MVVFALVLACASGAARASTGDPSKGRFDIWEYQVSGNTRLDVEKIERAVYPFLGEGRRIEDVEAAREALEKAYRASGYATVLVSIPEQLVDGGIVELSVTEGRIERVLVTGARYFSQGRILQQVPALAEGSVPNFTQLQEQLASVNTGDRRVQPLLRPGRAPGTTEIELKVDDSLPLHASIELNNRYPPSRAPNPGSYRASGTVRYDNLWQREHSVSLSYLTSPGHTEEAKVTSASYTLPLGRPGETLTVYGVRSNSNSDLTTSLAGTGVLGNSKILGVRLAEPIRSVGGINHGLTFGVDYKNILENLNQAGSASISTPLAYWFATAQYAGARADDDGETSVGATLGASVRGLRNNEQQFADKRFLGQGNFGVLRWSAQRVQILPRKFLLTARAEGQFSSLPLPSSEAYAMGGADSVRGYPEAVQIGDQGLRTMLEVRTPSLQGLVGAGDALGDLRALVFVEGAQVRVLSPLPGQVSRFTIASTGVGLRLVARRGVTLSLDYGRRLRDALAADTHGALGKGVGRLHFNLAFQI